MQTEVIKSLNTNQIDWINKFLSKKVWNQTREFQQYISQFNEGVCDRVHIPVLVRESFVPKGSFNSYIHEAHDIAQQILTHFSVRLKAPRRDRVNYPDMKKHKIDGLTKIINTTQKNQTIILIEFSFCRRTPQSKEDNNQIKLYRNSMRTLNKLLQSISKDIARVYLIQFANGLAKIKYLVCLLSLIYILQLFTCIKIPVSFDDFEQFAKKLVDLMEWQVDVLSTVRKMNKVTIRNTHNHITSLQDTPKKKKEAKKNQPSSPKSPCPSRSISELPSLI
ncbi:11127_t:CDS:2 [Funneliformis caledonium]|uniref:11127_t:CDS:1 n=1 Tax=Funneliformis caledonium TaxID=1117310 RepID=A0A9N9HN59_9GLOM|nr:11127_t:CDS:2 [Funneliformis caledonium]